MSMSNEIISGLANPTPILQQEKSTTLTTNPFITEEQRKRELQDIQDSANKLLADAYNKNKTTSIADLSLNEINKNMSSSIIGFFDDLFVKPVDITWKDYIPMILERDNRYTYIGVLLILIALYMLIAKQ